MKIITETIYRAVFRIGATSEDAFIQAKSYDEALEIVKVMDMEDNLMSLSRYTPVLYRKSYRTVEIEV